MSEHLPVLVVIVLLLCSYILPLLSRRFSRLSPVLFVGSLLMAGWGVLRMLGEESSRAYAVGAWPAPFGIEVLVNPFNLLMAALFVCVGVPVFIAAVFFSHGRAQAKGWTYASYLLMMAALLGIAFTNDLFNLYVFIELLSITGVALVISAGSGRSALAGLKYLFLASIGSGFILLGIGLLYIITGHLHMDSVRQTLAQTGTAYPHLLSATLGLFLIGFGIKAALFPLHVWLPDAHASAPAPASAILSALAVKGALVAWIKVYSWTMGPELLALFLIPQAFGLLGSVAILGGSLFALVQSDIKRRLAYSSVAQIGYIFLALATQTVLGWQAALLQIGAHAMSKSLLFLAAGLIYKHTGAKSLTEYAGVGRRMPLTMGLFALASLSMIGLPLTIGFLPKWDLLLGSWQSGHPTHFLILILGSLLAAAYLFPVVGTAYLQPSASPRMNEGWQLLPLVLLGAMILGMGVWGGGLLSLVEPAVQSVFTGGGGV